MSSRGGPLGGKSGRRRDEALPSGDKVAFLYATFPQPTETFLRRELSVIWERGGEVTPFSLWKGADWFEGRSVNRFRLCELWTLSYWLPYWLIRRPGAFREVLGELLEFPCQSFQNWCETFLGFGFGLVRAVRLRREGYVFCHAPWATMPATAALTVRELVGIEFSMGAHAYDVFRRGGDWLLRRKMKVARFVRTSSESTRRRLLELEPDVAEVVLIRRGLTHWTEPKGDFLPVGPLRILSIGRLVEKKGYFTQLAIYRALGDAGVVYEATIAGGGKLLDDLERERDRLGLSSSVRFLGHLPEDRVHDLYGQGDVLFFTGRIGGDGDRDGLPNVIPEAMAAGLVVITSPSAGAAEAVTDGETGFVLDPFKPDAWVDLVARLVREPSLVHSVGVTAAKVARRRFDARRNIAELWRRIIRACPIREEEE